MTLRLQRGFHNTAEAALWVIGGALLVFAVFCWATSLLAQQDGQQLLRSLPQGSAAVRNEPDTPHPGGVEAELEIQSIGLTVPVLTGCNEETLRRGACRILGTAVAGGLGNMAVAGHRDTRFRPLEHLQVGAVATVTDATGRYEYVVSGTEIVSPDEVRVLDIGDRPELTLITCFPFHYVGAAPKRYIVHATLRSVAGSAL